MQTLPQSVTKQSLQKWCFNTHYSAFHRHYNNLWQSNHYRSDASTHITQPSTDTTTICDKAITKEVMLQHTLLSLPQTLPQSTTKQWLQVIINTHYSAFHRHYRNPWQSNDYASDTSTHITPTGYRLQSSPPPPPPPPHLEWHARHGPSSHGWGWCSGQSWGWCCAGWPSACPAAPCTAVPLCGTCPCASATQTWCPPPPPLPCPRSRLKAYNTGHGAQSKTSQL